MTNDQFTAALIAFVLANGATVYGIARWGISRAIAYTHLERDVLELKQWREAQEVVNSKVQNDLKGISIKAETLAKTKVERSST